MATRLYLGFNAPVVSPTFDAGWETTTSAARRELEPFKIDHPAVVSFELIALAANTNSPAGAVDRLLAQYVSAPLDVDQTITGTIKGQITALESSATGDLRTQMLVWIRKADGTSRGTSLAMDTGALAQEWDTGTAENRKFPRAGAVSLTSVAALATDRIVIEVGFRKHESATTSRTGTIRSGNVTGTDLPEDETDTSAVKVPWFEFSQDLTFTAPVGRMTQESLEVLDQSTALAARMTQETVEVLDQSTALTARMTQESVEVLRLTNQPAGDVVVWVE
jgi:hypothetical protein